ncbi:hypothetical protein FS837_007683 [Tulasnella sp. UAMH 9824]|nr:hypothetical protein FS837_007683 [Tulasnella sp. UAMH 9824]
MVLTPEQIYEYADIVRQPTFSDEETLARIKAMDPFGRQLGDLGYQGASPGDPVWLAIVVSDVISHLLDLATTGAKNEGVWTMETLSNRARLVAIMHLSLFVPRLELDLLGNQKQVDDLIARVPRILEIYEKAIQSQDPPAWGGIAALRFPLLLIVGHLAHPATMTIIDEHLTLLQSKLNTMAWLVFTPFFQERALLDRKLVYQIHTGGNILRSYDEFNINVTSGIIDEAISRFGVSRMVQRSIVLCKASRLNDQELILGTRVLVLNLLEDQRFHEPFIIRKRVHRILANRFWECTRARVILQNDTLIKETYDLARAFERILQYLTADQLRAVVIQDLVMGHDLLPLIARVLLRSEERGSNAELDTLKIIDKTFSLLKGNLKTMAWLVFAPFFGDQKLSSSRDSFTVVCGGNILRSYYDVGINLTTRIMDEAISRFGISRIVEESTRFCKMTGDSSEVITMLGTHILVLDLMEDPRFHEPFILRGRVHRILVDRFWYFNRKYALKYDELSGRTCDVVNTLTRILGYLTDDRLQKFIVQDLVMHHDLLLLLARVALWADEEAPMGM